MEHTDFNTLPESCIAEILSFTTPSDAGKFSLVSTTFRSAADSDLVWEKFLPSNYLGIISKSITPLKFSSKKELYTLLCNNPLLSDNGRKRFKLDRSNGKISYMLSSQELDITLSDNPMYWRWKPISNSRFSQVAELVTISWLEIQGKMKMKKLSPNTTYVVYLVMKVNGRAFGLDSILAEVSVQVGEDQVSSGTAYLSCPDSKKQQMTSLFYSNRMHMMKQRVNGGRERVPQRRDDGWMEIEVGEFFCRKGYGEQEVKMSLKEVKGYQLKGGVVIEGLEIRPNI